MKRAVFPGTFDPITLGHVDIIKRALPLFDELIIAIGVNADKKTMFSLEERIQFIKNTFGDNSKIKVKSYTGLTANFCKNEKAQFIVRGLRNSIDFAYEQSIAQANAKVNGVDSIFLICSPEFSHISSSIVRDIARHGGDYQDLIP
ncbi:MULTISPECIES: pantetheine-phosphate adenylyltransferase [Aequorivita]|uniref:Phosphopantetheine adenylyltransferase n=1 Tax=Aequorivita iocasae TaxID=2803865 RepID=A0ABX7DSR8_9FLAO|nr:MULTISPECIES: pantetheine-phosphate adenylyltransferase [Aequorivita]QQX77043.1 pantetheine-phosphate adenylyltransferase [Aequorivita iocasae]UCA56522.1 pantetheine-phosphate adenylyltransferase [Aequorivita sp. F7]